MTYSEFVEKMTAKSIVPGESECCFIHGNLPGVVGCEAEATGIVVEERKNGRVVVMPGCSSHGLNFHGEPNFQFITFDALRHAGALA